LKLYILFQCFVYIKTPEDVCTQRSESDYFRVEVHPDSAELVKFTIVPLKAGEFELEISVFAINGTNDRVRKTIFVVVSTFGLNILESVQKIFLF